MTIESDILFVILDPAQPWEARNAALLLFTKECWEEGWDACDQSYREALALAGLVFDFSTLQPRHPEART